MRTVFLILALANVALFAYAWSDAGADANGDTQIIGQQLNPEKIRLLMPEQVSALTRKPEPPKLPATACLEWGAFVGGDAARAVQALEPLGLGTKLAQRKQEDVAGFWVYIPPLASRPAATQKAAELKRLGVGEYFVISDDPKWRNAISLGIFKTAEAASARLDALREKGVKNAISGAREMQLSKTYFQVRDANLTLAAKLNELKQGFAGTEVHECAPDEKKG
jgi:hypothetical protein